MASVYGPVSSRRFGQSIGINFIPPKTCTYSCVYCQLGRTNPLTCTRIAAYKPQEIVNQVQQRLKEIKDTGQKVDTLTFVSNGEPTLDLHIGTTIHMLKPNQIPIAVITNASLLFLPEMRTALGSADLVSVKIDSVRESTWQSINRPHGKLKLPSILNGIREFSESFDGTLLSETMLVSGLNDSDSEVLEIAAFIHEIHVGKAYLGLPLRPPCESWVKPPDAERLAEIFHIFQTQISDVEVLMSLPETELVEENQPVKKLLDILMVHPLSEPEIQSYLEKNSLEKATLENLVGDGKLICKTIKGNRYYLRNYLSI